MWTAGIYLALALSCGVGLALGLVGGGGSILIVPILTYAAGLRPEEAVALSLPVVGTTAAAGALTQYRAGNLALRPALLFSLAGMLGAALGAPWTRRVPSPVLMLLFVLLMAVIGARMLRGPSMDTDGEGAACRPVSCGLAGLGVGVLTGFLGVGGGFLIVPALLHFARLPMRKAVGTSLAIVAANSAAGVAGHLRDLGPHVPLAAGLLLASLAGLVAGTLLGRRMRPERLRTAFAVVALLVAAYVGAMNSAPLARLVTHGGW